MTAHATAAALPIATRGTAPQLGRLVTNHLNLLYMLAAGMVLPRSGFGQKYYQDTFDGCPGWIPLFTDRPAKAAVEHSVAEARHLRPCQVVISLGSYVGPVLVPGPGGVERRLWPHEAGDAPLIFVPAPLPLSAVERILFRSRDDLAACKSRALDSGNVPLDDFTTGVEKRFVRAKGHGWPPAHLPPEREARLEAAQAAGGMLALLRLLAQRDAAQILAGDEPLGLAAWRAAFDPQAETPPDLAGTVAAGLADWMRNGPSHAAASAALPGTEPGDVGRLFRGALDTLAEHAGAVGVDEANARLLDYLDREAASVGEKLRKHVVDLRETLASLTGLADVTVSELFERFRTPFPRAMALLFLRRTCAELLEFEHDALTVEDRLAAGMLFGARAGWLALPLGLRGGAAASAAVSHRMAALSHRLAETGFELGPAPERPKLLAEWFAGDWDERRERAAAELARRQKWTECLRTRVRLGAGDYELKVGRGGAEIVFRGDARAVEATVDRPQFSAALAEAAVTPEAEAEVVETLAGGGSAAPRRRVGGRRRADGRKAGPGAGPGAGTAI